MYGMHSFIVIRLCNVLTVAIFNNVESDDVRSICDMKCIKRKNESRIFSLFIGLACVAYIYRVYD